MARQIIVMEQDAPGGDIRFRAVFWLAVPAARQPFYANAQAVSAVASGVLQTGELAALQNGSVSEVVRDFQFPAGTTLATIQAALVAEYNAAQTSLNNSNRLQRYGSAYDGTTWTMVNRG
jgi:hypothetical protein